jgi:hypothetical protein
MGATLVALESGGVEGDNGGTGFWGFGGWSGGLKG